MSFTAKIGNPQIDGDIAYVWTHPHWAGVTRIFGNLPTEKMLIDITRICSK